MTWEELTLLHRLLWRYMMRSRSSVTVAAAKTVLRSINRVRAETKSRFGREANAAD